MSIALICLKMNFWAGPEVYHETGDWHNLDSSANIREESDIPPSLIK